MRRIATEQKDLITQLSASIESMTFQWSQAESVIEDFGMQLIDARNDMTPIKQCEL